MEELKHRCKICCKIFPSGRSLGGHMRSHLIKISPSSGHQKTLNDKRPTGVQKFVKKDTLLGEKVCKECGKSFHSWKALFGHMKCHSVVGRATDTSEDFSDSCDKVIVDDQSDNEAAAAAPCRGSRKRSESIKRYAVAANSSSSLTIADDSEVDLQEQEEVALSLILLSRDPNSVSDSISTCPEFLELECSVQTECMKFKGRLIKSSEAKRSEDSSHMDLFCPDKQFENKTLEISSSKRKKRHIDQLDHSNVDLTFMCVACRKVFPSYQALGGHRASHKKFKGCCAPSMLESSNSPDQTDKILAEKKTKSMDHECPICFKVFASGQALGGHKRSHLATDHQEKTTPEICNFLDLNLPAPVEEECNESSPWWIRTILGQKPELLSS